MGQPRPLFRLFSVFSINHFKFLQQIYVKKCPSSLLYQDSNPRPSEHASPPITTRPRHVSNVALAFNFIQKVFARIGGRNSAIA